MLSERPLSLVAPYSRLKRPLPTESDLGRLRGRSDDVYCTAPSGGGSLPRRDPAVEKTLREMAKARRVLDGRIGHVRARLRIGDRDEPNVEMFNGAYRVR